MVDLLVEVQMDQPGVHLFAPGLRWQGLALRRFSLRSFSLPLLRREGGRGLDRSGYNEDGQEPDGIALA
jgi:hypothetical protein